MFRRAEELKELNLVLRDPSDSYQEIRLGTALHEQWQEPHKNGPCDSLSHFRAREQ